MDTPLDTRLHPLLKSTFPAYFQTFNRLDSLSQSILSFSPPQGLSGSLHSLETGSQKYKVFGTVGTPKRMSLGLLYTANGSPVLPDDSTTVHSKTTKAMVRTAVCRVSQDGRSELIGAVQLTPSVLTLVSCLYAPQRRKGLVPSRPVVHAQAQAILSRSPNWTSVASIQSTEGLIGLSTLYTVQGSAISVGGEAFVSPVDKAGGFSLGIRYWDKDKERRSTSTTSFGSDSTQLNDSGTTTTHDTRPSCLVATVNPLMGHFSASSTHSLTPSLTTSTRFTFNTYSLSSTLSLGLTFSELVKTGVECSARWSSSDGIGLVYKGVFREALVAVGLTSDLCAPKATSSVGFSIEV